MIRRFTAEQLSRVLSEAAVGGLVKCSSAIWGEEGTCLDLVVDNQEVCRGSGTAWQFEKWAGGEALEPDNVLRILEEIGAA